MLPTIVQGGTHAVKNTVSDLTDAQRAAWLLDEAQALITLLDDVLGLTILPHHLKVIAGRVAWWGPVCGKHGWFVAARVEVDGTWGLFPWYPCPATHEWMLGHVIATRRDAEVYQWPCRVSPHWCRGAMCDGDAPAGSVEAPRFEAVAVVTAAGEWRWVEVAR
jgi:hypothetical protein